MSLIPSFRSYRWIFHLYAPHESRDTEPQYPSKKWDHRRDFNKPPVTFNKTWRWKNKFDNTLCLHRFIWSKAIFLRENILAWRWSTFFRGWHLCIAKKQRFFQKDLLGSKVMRHLEKTPSCFNRMVKSSRQMSEDIPQSSRKIIRVTWNYSKRISRFVYLHELQLYLQEQTMVLSLKIRSLSIKNQKVRSCG